MQGHLRPHARAGRSLGTGMPEASPSYPAPPGTPTPEVPSEHLCVLILVQKEDKTEEMAVCLREPVSTLGKRTQRVLLQTREGDLF